jgi:hypothetical protein
MALISMKNEDIKSKLATNASNSADLKKLLTEAQTKSAKDKFFNIRKAFLDAGCPMTMDDSELAELIRLKILKVALAEEF